jgi:hypothetical protein
MGHANCTALSKATIRQIYARGKANLRQILEKAVELPEHKCPDKEDPESHAADISMLLGEVINFYLQKHRFTPQSTPTPIIQPCGMDERQRELFVQWDEGGEAYQRWSTAEYEIFDQIKWQFAPGWRKRYPDLPLLGNFTC